MAREQSFSGNDSGSLAYDARETTAIAKVTLADLRDALIKGYKDFDALPSHGVFLCIIYPLIGIFLIRTLIQDLPLLPMLYPVVGGFALIGPVAAVGLYELSRRRELGLPASPWYALNVLNFQNAGQIALLGLVLLLLFTLWLTAAQYIYTMTLGAEPMSSAQFVRSVFSTPAGWNLIVIGNGVGFLFAVLTFSISVFSFPLILDRNVSASKAVAISVRAVAENPAVMAVWGMIIATGLIIGSLPLLVGLIVILPVLGHASWHLYRKVIV